MVDEKILIELWSLSGFTGIIVPAKTGIVYTNQCGGTMCSHPKQEGFYVPLRDCEPWEDPLIDSWERKYRPNLVREFLSGFNAPMEALEEHEWDSLVKSNTLGCDSWGEAWIPVRIVQSTTEYDYPELRSIYGRVVIITYQNSD